MSARLGATRLFAVAARLAFGHGAWTEGAMESVGLAYGLTPALRHLHPEPAAFQEALQRYREPFNTHPYLVGVVAGVMLKLEEEGRAEREAVTFLRSALGSLAAMGDPFFYTAFAPFVAAVAVGLTLAVGPWVGVPVLVVLFNLVHLGFRLYGVRLGYRYGEAAVALVGRGLRRRVTSTLKIAAALLLSLVVALLLRQSPVGADPIAALVVIATGVLAAIVFGGWRFSRILVAPAVLAVVILLEVLS